MVIDAKSLNYHFSAVSDDPWINDIAKRFGHLLPFLIQNKTMHHQWPNWKQKGEYKILQGTDKTVNNYLKYSHMYQYLSIQYIEFPLNVQKCTYHNSYLCAVSLRKLSNQHCRVSPNSTVCKCNFWKLKFTFPHRNYEVN